MNRWPVAPVNHKHLIARAEKKDDQALTHFEAALAANPQLIEPLAQIAAIHLSKKRPAKARARVAQQLEASPKNPLIHNRLGKLWMVEKNIEKAEAEFRTAIELNNALPISYMNLAALYLRTARTDEAVQEYEAALSKNPNLVSAHMILGIIHEQQGRSDEATSHYQAALTINPNFAPAANNLAWIMVEEGDNIDMALAYAQTAREQLPEDPSIADTLGWIYYKKNAYLKANSLLKEAAKKLAENPIVQYHYGMAQHKNGNNPGAKKTLQAALKLSSNFPGADDARETLKNL